MISTAHSGALSRGDWLVPVSLLLLGLVPAIAGVFRLVDLSGDTAVTAANARFVLAPVPVVEHVVAALIYSIVGAFQFSAAIRRRWPSVHRVAGRVLFVAGSIVALSGLWMTLFYAHPELDSPALFVARLAVGTAMLTFLALGLWAAIRRRIASHRAFMVRAYALAMGAGTQVFTTMPYVVVAGPPDAPAFAGLMVLGWAINVAIAELIVRRAKARKPPKPLSPGLVPGASGA